MIQDRCALQHRRRLAPGEAFTAPDGSVVAALGGEVVWDEAVEVPALHPGSALCSGHAARLRELIARGPRLVAWLRSNLMPGSPVVDDFPARTGFSSKPPALLSALDTADDLVAVLCSWAQNAAEDLGHAPPSLAGAWMAGGQVMGLLCDKGLPLVDNVVRWLLGQYDHIICRPWAPDMATELSIRISLTLRRWPLNDEARHLPSLACHRCQQNTLTLYPPAGPPEGRWAHPILVACNNLACGHVVPEGQWRFFASVLESEHPEVARRAQIDLLDIDAPEPITITEAAQLVGRSKTAVYNWIQLGRIRPLATDAHGHLLDRCDVLRVDRHMRERRGR